MLTRFPRKFRSRTLLAVMLIGISLLTVSYYFPISQDSYLREDYNPTSNWWHRLWDTSEICSSGTPRPSSQRIDTGEIYPKLDFGVPDNHGIGFWNEALESRYRQIRKTWKDLPLKVIVVPHSHTDPGWLRTYDDYLKNSVSHILDNMVNFLNKTEDFKFIWSEISFFADWWEKQSKNIQDTVKKIIARKQLEIVTGGWVMTDEATTSYFGIINQLVEGHQWLNHFLKVIPRHGWSVDVFGHSASIPYIISMAGISETVILRTHYSWKRFLAKMNSFDFYWEQPFDSPRILCHMAPSDLYSFKHTCGPDPFSCLKYDFRKVGGEYSESTADEITDGNVELKASYLIGQYGRFASLFSHNVLLVPLGDDFRYNLYMEWVQQYENYKKLFDYINKKKEWNVEVKFGTVSDYFEAVNERLENNENNATLFSISGDFFPYADIYADSVPSYWTGYYSTRPFYKKLSQELEHWLRSSEILYSLAKTLISKSQMTILIKDYSLLMSARKQLSLFQHHDAITGTSKENVMVDYGERLHAGIIDAMSVMSHLTQALLMEKNDDGSTWTSQVYPDVYRSSWNYQTKKLSIQVPDEGRKIVLFNSLTFERVETIRLKVRTPDIRVLDSDGNQIDSQINPTWKGPFVMSNTVFELIFVAVLRPLSFCTYTIQKIPETDSNKLTKSVISLFLRDDTDTTYKHSAFNFERNNNNVINLESSHILAKFSSSGVLEEVYMKKSGVSESINLDFRAYIPKPYRSGAYLFQPESNNPLPISNLTDHFPLLCIVRGPVVSELIIVYHDFLKATFRVYNHDRAPSGLQIEVSPDISKIGTDTEFVLRVSSDIKNDNIFYTDSNGLQMLKREYITRLAVQSNYYPVTSAIYIEDKKFRLSLLVPYSHGSTSPEPGAMEVMIDRRMRSDDSRGMGEGVLDNRLISTSFWLIPEYLDKALPLYSLSSEAYLLSLSLQYPVITMVTDNGEARVVKSKLSFISKPWPVDIHIVSMRNLPSEIDYGQASNSSLMIIHERYNNCKTKSFVHSLIEDQDIASFKEVKIENIVKTSLTSTIIFDENKPVSSIDALSKLQACKITFL